MREVLACNDVRTLIANQLGVDLKRVTDEAHFTDDLGADWLDRLELRTLRAGRHPHAAGDVCRGVRPFSRDNLSSVIDGRR
jgi:hypothetical protein